MREASRMAAHWSSETVEWYTPANVFWRIVEQFGPFELDPCADPRAPVWGLIPRHWTREDDGLSQEWHGRVFVNPPYGRVIGQWTAKAAAEVAAGRADCVVCLVPSRTDTQWWHAAIDAGAEPVFLPGRVRFIRQDGTQADSAAFPSALLVFRSGERDACAHCGGRGWT